jgi:hypothetical protein
MTRQKISARQLLKTTKTRKKTGATKARTNTPAKAKKRILLPDKVHAPGHRRLNLKDSYPEDSGEKRRIQPSALNRMSPDERINQMTAQKRIDGFINSAGQRRRAGSKRTP